MAPKCITCSCTREAVVRGLDGNPHGGCGTQDGWCFLENIADPSNPASRCYEDTQWSEVDGR